MYVCINGIVINTHSELFGLNMTGGISIMPHLTLSFGNVIIGRHLLVCLGWQGTLTGFNMCLHSREAKVV